MLAHILMFTRRIVNVSEIMKNKVDALNLATLTLTSISQFAHISIHSITKAHYTNDINFNWRSMR